MKLANNFYAFIDDFEKETGLDARSNLQLYTHYVNARLADMNMQLLKMLCNKILEEKA